MTITYDIDKPEDARRYVADFGPRLFGKEVTWVVTGSNRIIHFKTMSDNDACWVAYELWRMADFEAAACFDGTPPPPPPSQTKGDKS